MKIVFLGNSLVEGSYGGSFVAEVARLLPEHTIINAGQNGSTALNLLRRLDDVLADEPDGIFVLVGGNDAISYSQPDTRRYYEQAQHIPGGMVTPTQFAQAYRELLTRIQLAHIVAWVGLEPAEYNPATLAALREYNALAKEAAESLNIPVLDLMARLNPPTVSERPPLTLATINRIGQRIQAGWADYESERQKGGYAFTFDGLHLTPETAARVAQWIVEFVNLK